MFPKKIVVIMMNGGGYLTYLPTLDPGAPSLYDH